MRHSVRFFGKIANVCVATYIRNKQKYDDLTLQLQNYQPVLFNYVLEAVLSDSPALTELFAPIRIFEP